MRLIFHRDLFLNVADLATLLLNLSHKMKLGGRLQTKRI